MHRKAIMVLAIFALLAALTGSPVSAETVKLGVVKVANVAPVAIAIGKGYFTAEGLDVTLTYFESQAPVAVAVASGDLDFGDAAETAALYTLAQGGRARIIAGGANEAPSFHSLAIVASNQAYAAGLKTPKDLAGHSFALTQMGTGLQYTLGQTALKLGFDVNGMRLLPLQSNPNVASAVTGGRADLAFLDATNALPLVDKGDAKLIGWVGEITGILPTYFVFASRDAVDNHPDTVKRFVAAMRKAENDYYDAFTDAQHRRKNGPTATETFAMIAKFLGQSPETVKDVGVPYIDREGRVDMAGLQSQIDWYRSIGAIKGDVQATTVVDARYAAVVPAPSAAGH